MFIKKKDLKDFNFLQIPRNIWEMYIDKKINDIGFEIYIEFFDRLKLSSFNNWVDEKGNVYIKYSYEELMKILKLNSKGSIAKGISCLKELNLIIQEKGFNTSSKFYLSNILKYTNVNTEVHEREHSSTQMETQKYTIVDANNNNYNNNNYNNNKFNNTMSSNSTTQLQKEIIDYLNLKTNSNYKYTTKKTQTLINTRLKESFTLEDFKKVIDKKVSDWAEDGKMSKFLRPETLFGTKFESYLNEKTSTSAPKKEKFESTAAKLLREMEEKEDDFSILNAEIVNDDEEFNF